MISTIVTSALWFHRAAQARGSENFHGRITSSQKQALPDNRLAEARAATDNRLAEASTAGLQAKALTEDRLAEASTDGILACRSKH